MDDKILPPPVNYVSNSPARDWINFQNAMRHILTVPKSESGEKEEQEKEELAASSVSEE